MFAYTSGLLLLLPRFKIKNFLDRITPIPFKSDVSVIQIDIRNQLSLIAPSKPTHIVFRFAISFQCIINLPQLNLWMLLHDFKDHLFRES